MEDQTESWKTVFQEISQIIGESVHVIPRKEGKFSWNCSMQNQKLCTEYIIMLTRNNSVELHRHEDVIYFNLFDSDGNDCIPPKDVMEAAGLLFTVFAHLEQKYLK